MASLISNFGSLAKVLTRNAVTKLGSSTNALASNVASNRIVGPSIKAAQGAAQPFKAAGGARGVYDLLKFAAQAEASHSPGIADEVFGHAAGAIGSLASGAVAGAKSYLLPGTGPGRWDAWARRMGYLGAGAFIGGSAWRFATGTGTPVTDERGRFDIAGIPFV